MARFASVEDTTSNEGDGMGDGQEILSPFGQRLAWLESRVSGMLMSH